MSRFLFLAIFLIVAIGLSLHFNYEIPWFSSWLGTLPGDMTIRKGDVVIYVPLTTSIIISAVGSIVLSALFGSPK